MGDGVRSEARAPRWQGAALLLAPALVAALAAALVGGLRAGLEQAYWQAGYLRLLADEVTARLDPWGGIAAGAALGLGALAAGVRRWRRAPARPWPRLGRAAVAVVALVAALRLALLADAVVASRGPNLVLISVDTLRADHLGCYGSARPTSPAVDARLAATGVTFENVVSQSPKTTPSHMTMLTSLYPSVHGVEMWKETEPGKVLNPAVLTLAEVLKNAGYATAAFTGGANVHRSRGFDQGFDVYRNGNQLARTRRWLDHHARFGRFFLFFHTFDVHDPYTPPDDKVALFLPDYHGPILDAVHKVRAGGTGWWQVHDLFWGSVDRTSAADADVLTRLYDAGIRAMDEATLAPLLDHLAKLGLERDTLVVFTSDHGEAFGEHGEFMHEDLYAGTLHVPLILRFPGRLPAGRRVAARVRLIDLMPTVLDLLGVHGPPAMQGESLVPLLTAGGPAREAVSEHFDLVTQRAFRTLRRGDLAYMRVADQEQLFDLAHDPGETTNVAAARPADLDAMRARLGEWQGGCARLAALLGPRGPTVAPSAETVRQLRALGYVD